MALESAVRQNFAESTEQAINEQINRELHASYTYLNMSTHFDRPDVAMQGVALFFARQSADEQQHAAKLIRYLNSRGGRVLLGQISKPSKTQYTSPLEAFEEALEVEKGNNHHLLQLHSIASKNDDADLSSFLEDHYLHEQIEEIETMAKYIAQLKRAGPGLGEQLFDRQLLYEKDHGRSD